MIKSFGRSISVIMIFVLLISMNLSTVEAKQTKDKKSNEEIVHAEFTYINMFKNNFTISSSGNASVSSTLNSYNVDEVRIVGYLQQYTGSKWKTIKTWSSQTNGTIGAISSSWYVSSGYSYRYLSYAYLYKDGSLVESTSATSNAIYY